MLSRFRKEDGGYALIVSLGVASVLAIVVTTLVATTIKEQQDSSDYRNRQGAYAAARAGVDEYLYRINSLVDYWRYDSDNPDPSNKAFTEFVDLPVSTGVSAGQYTYDIDSEQLGTEGNLYVTVTGRVGTAQSGYEYRTLSTQLRRKGFLDFLYLTENEVLDPRLMPLYGYKETVSELETRCGRTDGQGRPSGQYYDVNGTLRNYCIEIRFGSGDHTRGPLHSNDRIWSEGAVFHGRTASANRPTLKGYGTFHVGGGVEESQSMVFPTTNNAIRAQADPTIDGLGCLYTGPTEIIFDNDHFWVRSLQTTSSGSHCGSWPSTALQRVKIPENGVIYVDSANTQHYTCSTGTNGLGYPYQWNGFTARTTMAKYGCTDGDAFVEGTVDGRATVAADNNVIVTWHLDYKDKSDSSDDMVGLIASNFLQIYHPVMYDGYWKNMPAGPRHPGQYFQNPRVDAALFARTGSILVPDWHLGNNLGNLTVKGAMVQSHRGPVAATYSNGYQTGYFKNYIYDQRFKYQTPPHFLSPVDAAWREALITECPTPSDIAKTPRPELDDACKD